MIIQRNKKTLIPPLIVFIIFTVLCLLCVFIKDITGNIIVNLIIRVIFSIAAVFFSFLIVRFIIWLIKNENVIETSNDGFFDRSGVASFGFIEYKDIESFYVKEPFLVINLKNPDDYLKKVNLLKKFFSKSNKRNGLGYVSIPLSTFNTEEVFNKFIEYLNNSISINHRD